ncbi:MAG: uridine kinase [Acidimicrobiales bacterium]|nr:uridine kinase [Acidimicrobiales bacterium]
MSFLVAVCGGSCSGKSTLAARILRLLGPATASLLAFDSYYLDQRTLTPLERAEVNYDHPSSLDVELFSNHLGRLAAGKPIDCPVYDFATHTRLDETRRIDPAPVVVVDGILLLADDRLVPRFDMRIYRQCPEEVRLDRRIERDVMYRGRTEDSVRKQFATTVKPMHDQFVAPSSQYADVVFQHEDIEVHDAAVIVVDRIRRELNWPAPTTGR